jgi:hypothetical protein
MYTLVVSMELLPAAQIRLSADGHFRICERAAIINKTMPWWMRTGERASDSVYCCHLLFHSIKFY